jgi:hypothetical protein
MSAMHGIPHKRNVVKTDSAGTCQCIQYGLRKP